MMKSCCLRVLGWFRIYVKRTNVGMCHTLKNMENIVRKEIKSMNRAGQGGFGGGRPMGHGMEENRSCGGFRGPKGQPNGGPRLGGGHPAPPHELFHELPREHHCHQRPPHGLLFNSMFSLSFYDRMRRILFDIENCRPLGPDDRNFMIRNFGRPIEPYEVNDMYRWLDDERRYL
jgi:hypothetical protein